MVLLICYSIIFCAGKIVRFLPHLRSLLCYHLRCATHRLSHLRSLLCYRLRCATPQSRAGEPSAPAHWGTSGGAAAVLGGSGGIFDFFVLAGRSSFDLPPVGYGIFRFTVPTVTASCCFLDCCGKTTFIFEEIPYFSDGKL